VSYENEPEVKHDLKVKPKHIAKFEADGFRMSNDEGSGISWLYRLAWYAAGKPDTYESWLDTVEDVESDKSEEDDQESGPTSPGSPG